MRQMGYVRRALTTALLVLLLAAASLGLAQNPVTITVWMGSWWADQAPLIIEEFEREHPDINVVIETLPINGYIDVAISSTLGGNPPDLLALDSTMISSMAGRGLLLPWDDYIQDLDISDFGAGIWSAGVFDGQVYALPYRGGSMVYFYNETMFDEAGLDYPTEDWTYQDMLEMAQQITVPGEKYGVGIAASLSDQANVFTSFSPVLWAFGGDFLNEDNTESALHEPNAVRAIEFWTGLYTTHRVVPEGSIDYALTRDVFPMFVNNQVAMMPGTSNTFTELNNNYPDVRWGMQLPPDKVGRGGGWSFTIPVTAARPEQARQFALWFVQPENLGRLTIREPARASATNVAPWNSDEFQIVFRAAPYSRIVPSVAAWTEIQPIIITELQRVLQGSKTPQQAADDMTRQINPLLR